MKNLRLSPRQCIKESAPTSKVLNIGKINTQEPWVQAIRCKLVGIINVYTFQPILLTLLKNRVFGLPFFH